MNHSTRPLHLKYCASAFGLVLGLLAAGRAHAQPAAAVVPLCVTEFPPYVSADLPDGGSLTAMARRAFAAAGLKVQVLRTPWVRAFALAKSGECLLLSLWRNEERDALFSYSLPVARMQLGLFVRADAKDAPLPADARIAFQRGSYLPPALTEGRYRLNEIIDPRPGAEMLQIGRVDAVFSERASFEYQLAQRPELAAAVRWQAPALEIKTTHMAILKTHPQASTWLELLNREIQQSVRL
ncbi:MAG: transporter substrate-binding domain-containing protein [Roseateles sp.]|jgi:polar amino acid transport system substrate-binding protein|nr:hypothetical protein [Methylibium sp.]MBY0368320.1 transporter substrate-binding domain-containing protein [Burkholderiaceae bacterium]|mmetsp:Transcript_548/g.1150  ORF Transcript_548/g.1150 Transcript_548/m.1150 type:complete len:240 (-) Transcript_548:90-809(-)